MIALVMGRSLVVVVHAVGDNGAVTCDLEYLFSAAFRHEADPASACSRTESHGHAAVGDMYVWHRHCECRAASRRRDGAKRFLHFGEL